MLKNNLPLLLLFISVVSFAQIPCSGGKINQAGSSNDYPCSGLTYQSRISASALGGDEAQDSWGWTDSSGDEFAVVALDNGTAFVNITDPNNPINLGRLPSVSGGSNLWRDVKVYSNHAYIVSEVTNDGLQIFDLTQLSGLTSAPGGGWTSTATLSFGDGGSGNDRAHNIVINEDSGFAYVVGVNRASNNNNGPIFISLANPAAPVIVGEYGSNDYFHDAQVVTYDGPDLDYTGKELMIGCNENNIVIVDVTNKANPVDIATFSYPNTNYTHQGWFTEDKRFFILGDETDEENVGFNTRTLVFDLQDLDNIPANNGGVGQAYYTYTGATAAIDHNGYVRGNRFYLANYSAGVRVLKLDGLYDPTPSMTEVAFMDTYVPNSTAAFNGTWNVYPYFESGNIISTGFGNANTNGDGGLFIMKDPNYDNVDPVANCAPFVATLDRVSGSVTVVAADIDNGSTDNFGIVKSTITGQTTFSCADVGSVFNVTLTVEDDYGNKNSCATTITVAAELNTYTAGGWSQGAVPGPGSNAKFSNDYNTASGDIIACTCEIDATKTVTVGADDYLDIFGNIAVDGDLVVEHTGSVVQRDDAATVTKNGSINVEVTSPILKKRDFMVMGSPMDSEAKTGVWSSAFLVLDFHPENFIPHPLVPAGGTNFADDNGNFYQTYTGVANAGEAFVVRPQSGYNDPTVPPAGRTFDFTYALGTLNNGAITYTNFNNGPVVNPNGTPNMVANPFASAIDSDTFMAVNTGITELYFWEHQTAPGAALPISNLRYDMDDFSLYNGTMGIPAASDPGNTNGTAPNGIISTAQGFGVRTSGAAGSTGTITFNNSMRLTSGNTTLRRPQVPAEKILLEVRELTYNLGGFAGVAFKDGATDELDTGMDSNRLATIVSLYSHLDNASEELGIQTRGTFDPAMQIPMGFATQIEEELSYKISLADIQGVNLEEVNVFLMDHQTGRIQNLVEDSYAFTSGEATDHNRFTLYFEEAIVLGPQEIDLNNIVVFPNPVKDKLTITSTKSYIQAVEVFDLTARRMTQNIQGKKNSCEIDLSKLETAVYFVKITTEAGSITKKIIKQ